MFRHSNGYFSILKSENSNFNYYKTDGDADIIKIIPFSDDSIIILKNIICDIGTKHIIELWDLNISNKYMTYDSLNNLQDLKLLPGKELRLFAYNQNTVRLYEPCGIYNDININNQISSTTIMDNKIVISTSSGILYVLKYY